MNYTKSNGFYDIFLRDGPLYNRQGIRIAALAIVQRSQIVQRGRDAGMVGTEAFLSYCQRPLVQRFSIGIATLRSVQLSQIVQKCANAGMIRTEDFLLYCQRPLVQRLGFRITPAFL